jgi:hypothetical protein
MTNAKVLLLATAVISLAAPLRAGAEVRLSGSLDSVALEATNATMPEIVAALQSTFRVKISLAGSTSRRFTGAYSGSLRRVLARLLDGGNYVISPVSGGMSIAILMPNAARPGMQRVAGANVAFDAAGGNAGVQGWSPGPSPPAVVAPASPRPPTQLAAAAPASALAAGMDEGGTAQGWVPAPSSLSLPLPPATQNGSPGVVIADADEGSNDQGWVPKPDPLKAPGAADARQDPASHDAATAPTAAGPRAAPDEGSSVQGWIPKVNPFAVSVAPSAGARVDVSAPPPEDPPAVAAMQGWSGWSGPLPGETVRPAPGVRPPMMAPAGPQQDN